MTIFRPCIDLHEGVVKQIVGGTLTDAGARENHVSSHEASWFAKRYQSDGLKGGHVIKLGGGNDEAARSALQSYPGGLQVGGGIDPNNARQWLVAGASQVIVTSYLFDDDNLSKERLDLLASVVDPTELVIDLSCRQLEDGFYVTTNRWQTVTRTRVDQELFELLAPYCSEFLVHAADVEGLCQGIEEDLVVLLSEISPHPCTYAGGARDISDLGRVESLSKGRVDLTFGSALDLFGGSGVRYAECVEWNRRR